MIQPTRDLDLAEKTLGTDCRSHLRPHHLDRNRPIVPEVALTIHERQPALTVVVVERVGAGACSPELLHLCVLGATPGQGRTSDEVRGVLMRCDHAITCPSTRGDGASRAPCPRQRRTTGGTSRGVLESRTAGLLYDSYARDVRHVP